MPEIKPGNIYLIDIPQNQTVGTEQYKERPYVIMSRLAINRLEENVVGVPFTKNTKKANSYRILIPKSEITPTVGNPYTFLDCVALTDMIRVLAVVRLGQYPIGTLSRKAFFAVQAGIAYVLDLP